MKLLKSIMVISLLGLSSYSNAIVLPKDYPASDCQCLTLNDIGMRLSDLTDDAWFIYNESGKRIAAVVEAGLQLEESLQIEILKSIYRKETNKTKKKQIRQYVNQMFKLNW